MRNYDLTSFKNILPKLGLFASAALVLAGIVVLAINFYNSQQPPKVLATSPKNGDAQADPFAPITILFDRDVSADNKSRFSIFPDVPGQFFIRNRIFEFVPNKHLNFGTEYTLTLNRPSSAAGKVGDSLAIAFSVKKIDGLNLDQKLSLQREQDAAVKQQAEQITQTLDGRKARAKINLLSSVPFDTTDFTVEYLRDQDIFYVTIKKNPYATSRQEAVDWFKSKGVEDMSWVAVEYGSVRGVYP